MKTRSDWHWPWSPRVDITDYDDPSVILFTRWFVFGCPLGAIMIHKLRKSDVVRRGVHDHPWNFVSAALWNNYHEVRTYRHPTWNYTGPERCRIFRHRRATDLHRVVLNDESKPVWTLVIHGRRLRDWGFFLNNVWSPWYEMKPAGATDYHDDPRHKHPSMGGEIKS